MNEARQLEGLMTLTQAAEYLAISPKSLWRRASSGEIPSLKLWPGRRAPLRFSPEQLRAWLDQCRVQPPRPRLARGRSVK